MNKIIKVKLPKNFFECIIFTENNINVHMNIKDINNLINLYKIGMEYYSSINNIEMFEIFNDKMKKFTSNKRIINYLENNNQYSINLKKLYKNLDDKINNKKQIYENLNNDNNKIINEKIKEKDFYDNNFNSNLIKNLDNQENNFKLKLKNKKNLFKKEKKLNENIKNLDTNIFSNDFENLYDIIKNLYEDKYTKIYDNLESIYDNKIKIVPDHIETMKELELLSLDDIQNKNFYENFIQNIKLENLKKIHNLTKSQKNFIINTKKIISKEDLLANQKINDLKNKLYENILNTISI